MIRLLLVGLLYLSLPAYGAETTSAIRGLAISTTNDWINIILEDFSGPESSGCIIGLLQVNALNLAASQILFSGLLAAKTTGSEVLISYVPNSPAAMLCSVTEVTIL